MSAQALPVGKRFSLKSKQRRLFPRHKARQPVTLQQTLVILSGIAIPLLPVVLPFSLPLWNLAIGYSWIDYFATGFFIFIAFNLLKLSNDLRIKFKSYAASSVYAISDDEVALLTDKDLPIFTVLAPLYREAHILKNLVASMKRLDYPPHKLEVLVCLESKDTETIATAHNMTLPANFKVLIFTPEALSSFDQGIKAPQTKPRACNLALDVATGSFVTIYDAEDRPDPDQLKKFILAFRKFGPTLGCAQARLLYRNPTTNPLTRLFTIEYLSHFKDYLPGLSNSASVVPLGGTSNCFRTSDLRILGAWDPFNVAEDCDLGVTLARLGKETVVINSDTTEEANSDVWNWIRQRSRWIKGYLQTYFVHMRDPIQLYKDLGFKKFVSFQLVIGGTPLVLMLNPFFWLLTAVYAFSKANNLEIVETIELLFPWYSAIPGFLCMILGNMLMIYLSMVTLMREQKHNLIIWALCIPIYYVLMYIAGLKALKQFVFNPHYWEKTNHGLIKEDDLEEVFPEAALVKELSVS